MTLQVLSDEGRQSQLLRGEAKKPQHLPVSPQYLPVSKSNVIAFSSTERTTGRSGYTPDSLLPLFNAEAAYTAKSSPQIRSRSRTTAEPSDPRAPDAVISFTSKPAKSVWRLYREEAMSTITFHVPFFFKSLLYESVPVTIGGLLCWSIDGLGHNRARALNPKVRGAQIVIDEVQHWGFWFLVIRVFFGIGAEIPAQVSLAAALMYFSRSTTVSIKYSLFGDQDIKSPKYGMENSAYWMKASRSSALIAVFR